MKLISLRFIAPLLIVLSLLFAYAVVPVQAHDGEDHSEEEVTDENELKRQLLIQIIGLLKELIEEQASATMSADMSSDEHDHDSHEDHALDGGAQLLISVEIHDGRVHVHVDELGQDEVAFFLDDYELSDETGIVAAIAAETGFSEAEVEEATHFSTETADEHEEGNDEDDDLAGIHIMADGTVMLGNGEVVEDATVDEDGMIVLSDGTLVEPTMDMR